MWLHFCVGCVSWAPYSGCGTIFAWKVYRDDFNKCCKVHFQRFIRVVIRKIRSFFWAKSFHQLCSFIWISRCGHIFRSNDAIADTARAANEFFHVDKRLVLVVTLNWCLSRKYPHFKVKNCPNLISYHHWISPCLYVVHWHVENLDATSAFNLFYCQQLCMLCSVQIAYLHWISPKNGHINTNILGKKLAALRKCYIEKYFRGKCWKWQSCNAQIAIIPAQVV